MTGCEPRRALWLPAEHPLPSSEYPVLDRLWRYGPALLLAGYLLLAHGCHGDEDTELFTGRHATAQRISP